MILNQTDQAVLKQTHDAYWSNYLKGDVPSMASLLADTYTQVGSAETEVFSNKKDAVQFLYDTIDQVAGKLEMRNRTTNLEALTETVLIHEHCDLYALADSTWIFYARFRATTIMEKKNGEWKIIHQHSSFPDSRTGDGQNVAIDKMAEENQQLREAIKRRTVELEHKNRELEIEAALERVRARAMAMQNSEELKELIGTVFIELTKLDLVLTRCLIMIYDPITNGSTWWMANSEAPTEPIGLFIKYHEHPPYLAYIKAWQEKNLKWQYVLEGTDKNEWDDFLFVETELSHLPDFVIAGMKAPDRVYLNASFNNFGNLTLASLESLSDEHFDVLLRFAKVFDLTYTRFNDLQKAEAQAREAQLEIAFERVRARAMAMHTSTELQEVALELRQQMGLLGQKDLEVCAIHLYEEDDDYFELWGAMRLPDMGDKIIQGMARFPKSGIQIVDEMIQMYSSDQKEYVLVNEKEKATEWFELVKKHSPEAYNAIVQSTKGIPQHALRAFWSIADFSGGSLLMVTHAYPDENSRNLLRRSSNVFDLAYRRYRDLKTAEAQAREFTIEASLEKVRGKAMAMHDSKDISSTAIMVFTELKKLGINPIRNGVGILSRDSRKGQLYSATSSDGIDSLALVGWVELSGHPILEKVYDSWYANEDYFPVLAGAQLKTYYEQLLTGFTLPSVPNWQSEEKQYGHFIAFSIGSIYSWASKPYTPDEIKIFKRFAAIIDLTFRRYLELQKSEANAKEAIKQSSLDRVRAEIASMRTVDDLSHITPIVWRELTTLGVPFFRCGIFIIKEEEQLVHIYLSTPEGKSLAVLHLPFAGADITIQTVNHWRNQEIYSTRWDRDQFIDWVKTLQGEGRVQSAESYQGGQAPPESLTLQFMPFTQGMLYIGSADALNEGQFSLAKELATAFSVAYARYEDFKKLEEAKSKIEATLTDLKAAQSQLIQSEKMASLGELTAGIAHEIQNPLNFVNNFSDVNSELIEELKTEALQGNTDGVIVIANDIKLNEGKINHHGKRAESIVKGMLEHSRKSTGIKELTDINKLCDEFVRLSYHGLRAKDKGFNCDYKLDLDPNLPLVNVVSQDIGRVLLNIINNAFQAVELRNKGEREHVTPLLDASDFHPVHTSFHPLVFVSTKNLVDKIEIRIFDNGNGIPENIIDKIFQPFFTTKPAGQGTGLGLSLAYDIIKSHGGIIKVKSNYIPPDEVVADAINDRKGSEFIILLKK